MSIVRAVIRCPHCQCEFTEEEIREALQGMPEGEIREALQVIPEELILQHSAAILGRRGRGEAKARDSEKMRKAGKLGGRPRKKK